MGGLGHDVGLKRGVGGASSGFGQTQFATDEVRALGDGDGFEKSDVAIAALPAKTAVSRNNQLLRRDVFQGGTDGVGDFLGAFDLKPAMTDRSDADFFLQLPPERREQ